jgi:hypothetical protein
MCSNKNEAPKVKTEMKKEKENFFKKNKFILKIKKHLFKR